MNPDSICYSEKLTFLKYINPKILFYFITLLVFAGIFLLTWILNKYTYFEKLKIPRGSIPKFPYGNFRDVVSHDTSLHEFAWRNYNRFIKKKLKYGGLFIFTKPVIIITDKSAVLQLSKLNNLALYKGVVPREANNLDYSKANRFFSDPIMDTYFEKHKNTIKGLFLENLQKEDFFSGLRNCLLETTCLIFGIKSCEMVEEINELLQEKSDTSFRYFLSLAYPIFKKSRKTLQTDLKEIFVELLNDRKKNDEKGEDLIETFIDLYNESQQCELEKLTQEMFDVFGDALVYSYSSSLFCIHELARNKEIQDDVIGQVRRFNRKNVSTSFEDLDYLDAIIKETLRKYPPVGTVIKSISSTSNGVGFQLPKDALILVSVLACHRDANNYTDPDTFDPDRFTDEVRPTKPNIFLPFGISPRSYIDKQLTTLILKLMLHGIFSSYSVTLDATSNLKVNPTLLYLSPCEDFRFKFNLL